MQSIALPRCAVTCRYMRALHTSGPVLRGLRRRPNADVRQELVLRATVPRLGVAGEVVAVKPGYARNYLVPKGLALFATPLNKGVYARPVHGGTATSKATPTAPTTGLVGESLQQTTHSKVGTDFKCKAGYRLLGDSRGWKKVNQCNGSIPQVF